MTLVTADSPVTVVAEKKPTMTDAEALAKFAHIIRDVSAGKMTAERGGQMARALHSTIYRTVTDGQMAQVLAAM